MSKLPRGDRVDEDQRRREFLPDFPGQLFVALCHIIQRHIGAVKINGLVPRIESRDSLRRRSCAQAETLHHHFDVSVVPLFLPGDHSVTRAVDATSCREPELAAIILRSQFYHRRTPPSVLRISASVRAVVTPGDMPFSMFSNAAVLRAPGIS